MNEAIRTALHRLGIYENTQGYYAARAAVSVALQEPESLLMVTKWLYPEAAKQCGGSWQSLEKNLRAAVSDIWKNHPDGLQALSDAPLRRKPAASQFVTLLASALCAGDMD